MQATSEMLVNMTVAALKLDPPPSEEEIDGVLDRLTTVFTVDSDLRELVRRTLHARFEIRMDLGSTLVSHDTHAPWLDSRRGGIDWFYWQRYREMLLRSGWAPLVLATLDRSTDDLLDLLGNPAEPDAWKRRGLVMGDVQSGKTASYAALMCKAADAGYRMIILLTGTLENVRRQTQERLDSGFVGFDSRGFLGNKGAKHKEHIGVGLIDPRRDGIVFTSSDHDFRKNAASALNISLNAVNEPVLVVAKKHKAVLERLGGWLQARNADRDGKIDVPLLLVDDEADNASVNTRRLEDPTSINKGIRDLLNLFRRSTYVGFTATPFANIFIDPESSTEMSGDDLFPNDFIHVLEAPSNYIGMHSLFPTLDPDATISGAAEKQAPLREIEDAEHWLSPADKGAADPDELPRSLVDAIRTFLLACAIRDLREEQGLPGGGGGPHRSMLVNVTHYTAVQNRIANLIHAELVEIRTQVGNYAALRAEIAEQRSDTLKELHRVFTREFGHAEQSWQAVLAKLNDAVGPVRVQPVNASTGAKSLDYRTSDGAAGVRVIAVGGNSLSRGLTLEGLSTSYFLRTSRAYDTLLQMGRWFGYRGGYADLCRVWVTAEAEGWYRYIADATAELKRDFVKMKKRQATPREFGLRVRTHPESLLITARNKMATGKDITVATHDLNLLGRQIESARIFSDRRRSQHNLEQVERLLRRAGDVSAVEESHNGNALLWRSVPAGVIANFLDEFLVHPLNFAFQAESIAEYLRSPAVEEDTRLATWTIALPTRGEAENDIKLGSLKQTIQTRLRQVKEDASQASLLISGKSARVGGKADVRHGLDPGVTVPSDAPEEDVRTAMRHPLLVLYLLRGTVTNPDKTVTRYKDGLLLPAVGLHFPGTSEITTPTRMVKYRLNKVGQQQLFSPDDGDDDTSDDVDDEN